MRTFTTKQLRAFHGRGGKSAYVAYNTKVYDVGGSPLWLGGNHPGNHRAGKDLTEFMTGAPHGDEIFAGFPVVGEFLGDVEATAETPSEHLKSPSPDAQALSPETRDSGSVSTARSNRVRRQLAMVLGKWHLHPIAADFPVALLFTSAFLMVCYFITGNTQFEASSHHVLVLGALSTWPAGLSGLLSWWVKYNAMRTTRFRLKIWLSAALCILSTTCLVWYHFDPDVARGGINAYSVLYVAVVISLLPLTFVLGYIGGRIAFSGET